MPEKSPDKTDKKKHFTELLADFRTAMLVTRSADGGLHARPLALAETHDDGRVYFATSVESPKVEEMRADERVAVTLQDSKRYVSLSGTAEITRDRALIDRLWSESWKIWFPEGKTDPAIAIVTVVPDSGEYWDQSGVTGVKYLFEAVKAYATGTKPKSGGDGLNAKVQL